MKNLIVIGVVIFALGVFFKFIKNTDDFNALFQSGVSIKDLRNALLMSDRVRQTVTIYAVSEGVFPQSNEEAKIQKKGFYKNKYINEIEIIGSGNVVVRLDNENYDVPNAEIVFSPTLANNQVSWNCYHVNVAEKPIRIGGNLTCLPIAKLEKPTLVEQVGNWESKEEFNKRMHEKVELKRKERELAVASASKDRALNQCYSELESESSHLVLVSGAKVFSLNQRFEPVDEVFIAGASAVTHAGQRVYVYGRQKITELKLNADGKFQKLKSYGSRPAGAMEIRDRSLLLLDSDMISVRNPCELQSNNYSHRILLASSLASNFRFVDDVLLVFSNGWQQSSIFTYMLNPQSSEFDMTGQILLPGGALNGVQGENYLWVNSGRAGISVVDITNHSWKKQHSTESPVRAINLIDDILIVGDADKKLAQYKISGLDIEKIGELELPSLPMRIATVNDHLVVSLEQNSAMVFRIENNKLTFVSQIDGTPAAYFGF